jgi:LysR family transcriptional regulator, transcriptional activator of the cysJI operon
VRAPQVLPFLQTFHVVATERSFTRAGQLLALSQPAVSAHVRVLERIYGVPLFEIRRRRAFLTQEGEALLTYTERIFNLVAEAEQAIAATRGLERGRLSIGASPTIGVHLLAPVLRQFADLYPGIRVQVGIARSEEIVAQVLAYRIQFGLVEAVVSPDPMLEVQPFASDDMVLLAGPDHPWARTGRISRRRLNGAPVLRREGGSGLRMLLDRMLAQAGVAVETAMELGSMEALIEAVRAGVGVAWVPRISVARDVALGQLTIVDVPGLDLRRELSVVCLRSVTPSGAAQAFLELLRRPSDIPHERSSAERTRSSISVESRHP